MKYDQLFDIKYDNTDELNVLISMSDYLLKQLYLEQYIVEGDGMGDTSSGETQQLGFFQQQETQPQTPTDQNVNQSSTSQQPQQEQQPQQQQTQDQNQQQKQKTPLMEKIKNVLAKIWNAITSFFKRIGEKLKNLKNRITGKNVVVSENMDPDDTGEVPNLNQTSDTGTTGEPGSYDQGAEQPDRINQEEELKKVQQTNDQLTKIVQQLVEEVQNIQQDKQQLESKVSELSGELDSATRQINNLSNQQRTLQNDVNNIQMDVQDNTDSIRKAINDTDNTINNLNQQISQLKTNQAQNMSDVSNEINELTSQLQQAQLQRQNLQSQIDQTNMNTANQTGYLENIISSVQGYVSGVEQKANESIALATNAKATVDGQIATVSRLNNLVNANMASNADQEARVANIAAYQENINNTIANLQNMTNSNNSELSNIVNANQMIMQRLNELENSIIQGATQNPNNTLTADQIRQIVDTAVTNAMMNQANPPKQDMLSLFKRGQKSTPAPQSQPQPQTPVPNQQPQQQPQPNTQPQTGFDNVVNGAEANMNGLFNNNQQTPTPQQQQPVNQQTTQQSVQQPNQTFQQKIQPTVEAVKNAIGTKAFDLLTKAKEQINKLGELNDKIVKSQSEFQNKLEGTVDQVVERVKAETKNIGNNAKSALSNLANAAQNNLIKYKDIPNDLKTKYIHLRFNIEIKRNQNAITYVPVVYGYNVPTGIFDLCDKYFDGVNALISTVAGLANKAKINVDSNLNADSTASYKNVTALKNQIGQICNSIENVFKSGQAEILQTTDWNNKMNAFTDKLNNCEANAENLQKLIPVITKAQEDNNNSGNSKANINRMNNLFKAIIDGSNYVAKSLNVSIGIVDKLVDQIILNEQSNIGLDVSNNKAA